MALVFAGVNHRTGLDEAMHMIPQCGTFRIPDDPKKNLACLTSDSADNCWAIVVTGTSSSAFVGVAPRWIPPSEVLVTLLSPVF
jgi:hypothetical protein